ncbi:Lipid A export ATP-binding/permease protein MsbA [Clostridiaceae bacterium JG1575]|nr:Lipid A export ATP-binding/permease protein MsbA [Clostridiaceae bacterium JG1575]
MKKTFEIAEHQRSLASNVCFLMRYAARIIPHYYLLQVLHLIAAVSLYYLTVWIPQQAVALVQQEPSFSGYLMGLFGPLALFFFSNTGRDWLRLYLEGRSEGSFSLISYDLHRRILETDYENIDGAAGQMKVRQALAYISENNRIFETLHLLLPSLVIFLLFAVQLFRVDVWILLSILLTSFLVWQMGQRSNQAIFQKEQKIQETLRKGQYLSDKGADYSYGKDARFYSIPRWFSTLYEEILAKVRRLAAQIFLHKLRYLTGVELLNVARNLLAYFLVLRRFYAGAMSLPEFIFYMGVVHKLSESFDTILTSLKSLQLASRKVDQIRDLLALNDHTRRDGTTFPEGFFQKPLALILEHVSYTYPGAEHPTIDDVSLRIPMGQKLALVGLNGAGKTTLIKLICGLYTQDSGTIRVGGLSRDEVDLNQWFSLFAVVFQDVYALPLSLKENITAGAALDEDKLEHALQSADLSALTRRLSAGLETKLVKSVYDDAVDLSGGEMQKLMLARAIYRDAPFLILDEPTASLDALSEERIYRAYHEISAQKTALFISHRLASTQFTDRVILFEDGKIRQDGTHEALMQQKGPYRTMYQAQSHYYSSDAVSKTPPAEDPCHDF